MECTYKDWPYIFIFSKQRIEAGEELFIKYSVKNQYFAVRANTDNQEQRVAKGIRQGFVGELLNTLKEVRKHNDA